MTRVLSITVCMLWVASFSVLWAQDKPIQEVPQGMEAIRLGASGWIFVPKGAKTRKVGAQLIVEDTREYMSRRFEEMSFEIEGLKEKVKDLTTEIDMLKILREETAAIKNSIKRIETVLEDQRQTASSP